MTRATRNIKPEQAVLTPFCGCQVFKISSKTYRMQYCSLHKAAPRMAQLLEYLTTNGWNASVSEEAKEILLNWTKEGTK